jgi:hypothetical protein
MSAQTKKETAYKRVRRLAQQFAAKVEYPRRRFMFSYGTDAKKPGHSWSLYDLTERVRAAQQIGGWRIELSWNDAQGLVVHYVEQPQTPEFK